MLHIAIPQKQNPVSPPKYKGYTKAEQAEVDFYKKRRPKYGSSVKCVDACRVGRIALM